MKAYTDLADWKGQFTAERSLQRRIGMLHSLFDPGEFEQLTWGVDTPKIAEALLWATWAASLDKHLTTKAIQMLLTRIYQIPVFLEGMDEQVIETVKLVGRVKLNVNWEIQTAIFEKEVESFLHRITTLSVLQPDEAEKVGDVVYTIVAYDLHDLLLRPPWLGNAWVIKVLRGKLRRYGAPLSQLMKAMSTDIHARHLAIHLAANGELDEVWLSKAIA